MNVGLAIEGTQMARSPTRTPDSKCAKKFLTSNNMVDEYDLIDRYRQFDDHDAMTILTAYYLPLMRIIAKRYTRQRRDVDAGDLIQVGWIAFERAVRAYDASKGASPKTFFRRRILSEMLHWLRDVRPAIKPLRDRNQSYAPEYQMISLDETVDAAGSDSALYSTWYRFTGADESGYERINRQLDLQRVLNHLPLLHRKALLLLFSGMTQTATAKVVGCSQKHVSRIFHQAWEAFT